MSRLKSKLVKTVNFSKLFTSFIKGSSPNFAFNKYQEDISELINIYSPRNYQKTHGSLMISGGIEINQFPKIHFIFEGKFKDNP